MSEQQSKTKRRSKRVFLSTTVTPEVRARIEALSASVYRDPSNIAAICIDNYLPILEELANRHTELHLQLVSNRSTHVGK